MDSGSGRHEQEGESMEEAGSEAANRQESDEQRQQKQPQDTSDGGEAPSRATPPLDANRIVRHIMVIGFHHKHGYQVEYCYPPLTPGGPVFTTPARPISLPACWKTLPLLCLPDGSHNYNSDAIYFTMPDVDSDGHATEACSTGQQQQQQANEEAQSEPPPPPPSPPTATASTRTGTPGKQGPSQSQVGIKTIFGTACYRQIHVEKLLNRTDDMTRVAVQKSVCVLSTQPLFGLIRSKLEMITHAYFEELDFSKVRILKLTYDNLNSLLLRESVRENATFLGLSARLLVSQFGNNMLVLYKAMLLEKKILFYKSPVRDLCSTIMSMCSLFNGLLECGGLNHSTCHLQLSANMLEALKLEPRASKPPTGEELGPAPGSPREGKVFFSPSKSEVTIELSSVGASASGNDETMSSDELAGSSGGLCEGDKMTDLKNMIRNVGDSSASSMMSNDEFESVGGESGAHEAESSLTSTEETSIDDPHAHKLCQLRPEDCGLPLQIFTRGSFCLPYLSISYLDLLADKRVRGFVIGATNFLFKQRREMYDVIVDMEENSIQISDTSLKRALSLTIEDLRFMDYISRHTNLQGSGTSAGVASAGAAAANETGSGVCAAGANRNNPRPNPKGGVVVDAAAAASNRLTGQHSGPESLFDPMNQDVTRWLGGDEWIRYHFKVYTLYLLRAAWTQSGAVDSFNRAFVQAWRAGTNNYRTWEATNKAALLSDLQARHPFSSPARGLNFSDMKLKLSYAVNSSERGRLVNQTLNGIGRWAIWNNLASAGTMAASTVSSIATSASSAATTAMGAAAAAAPASAPAPATGEPDDKSQARKSGGQSADKQ